ncbi:MAG: hypothetical protein LBU19_10615, partial [Treponema sp.]|nr:hypothetical protein [Treponema sp.]
MSSMDLKVRILNGQGDPASRDEIATIFAADTDYVPYRRNNAVSREGLITMTIPADKAVLQAKLLVPGYGFVWVSA